MNQIVLWLRAFADWINAWRLDPVPTPWGSIHLWFSLCSFAVCLVLVWLLRKVGERGFRATLLTAGFALAATEIVKQIYVNFAGGNTQYQWYLFPFQLCSVPMYLCIICGFLKPGRLRDALCDFMACFNLAGGFMTILVPDTILNSSGFLTFHSLFWHMALIFVGLFLALSRRASRTWGDYGKSCLVYLITVVIAFCLNLIMWKPSGGSANMFFIGPAITSMVVFHDIAEAYGWYASAPLYIFANCLNALIFFLPFRLWNRHLSGKAAPAAASEPAPRLTPAGKL